MKLKRIGFISLLSVLCFNNLTLVQETAKINTGDTAWLLVASAFVMLMTLPGLALFLLPIGSGMVVSSLN
ncbi:ammonium transporter [Thermodesulfobacterium hydrogeniphilum]|uniref:ammonium transporter n=1 Tax=Thermodesulfobacterium hydrogeniphilum TaxID=161156 RepID=UPI00056E3AAB|nr:ammonium transporter [Thermodesulfobacterium hydrogeniphilum]